jgi:uncharacterized protein (DUF2141 family)
MGRFAAGGGWGESDMAGARLHRAGVAPVLARIFFVLMLLASGQICAANVTVTVSGVRNAKGHVLVALCGRAEFLQPHCRLQGSGVVVAGRAVVHIDGVPPGEYAAQAFHDENDDGRLNRNFFGLPAEGLGFSRDAKMYFGPPRFEAASFAVGAGDLAIGVTLRYF